MGIESLAFTPFYSFVLP